METGDTKSLLEFLPGDAVVVFDDHGNAFDCFDYTPEALEERAKLLRASMVTMEPNPWARLA